MHSAGRNCVRKKGDINCIEGGQAKRRGGGHNWGSLLTMQTSFHLWRACPYGGEEEKAALKGKKAAQSEIKYNFGGLIKVTLLLVIPKKNLVPGGGDAYRKKLGRSKKKRRGEGWGKI